MASPPPPFMLPDKREPRREYAEPVPNIDSGCHQSILVVDNVHCASCIAYIINIFSDVSAVKHVDICILSHEVRVSHTAAIEAAELASILIRAAFDVHWVTTYDLRGAVVSRIETTSWISSSSSCGEDGPSSRGSDTIPQRKGKKELHIAHCDACKKESDLGCNPSQGKRPEVQVATQRAQQFRASITIEGMSCASCANDITEGITRLEFVEDASVNFISHSATVKWSGSESNGNKIVECVENMGFEAALGQVIPEALSPERESYVAELAIGGLTCGACVGAVTQGMEELQFVTKISVSLLSHTAWVEFNDKENIDRITSKIEAMGYDATVIRISPQAGNEAVGTGATAATDEARIGTRTVSILVDGMFCDHCPEKVLSSLCEIPNLNVNDNTFSLKCPILKVTYVPHPPSLTIRSILKAIESSHNTFHATVYRPPSHEERSRAMQQRARRRLLARLLFVSIIAIPTFIIGMVCMDFVPSESRIRWWLRQPVWFGSVSRINLSLLILSTPVMIYGADIFHTRAIREICALWRPGSLTPLPQRFYRFGSMNLLISAGTTVAYMSSCAALIANVILETEAIAHRSTCFDTVVFLTLFILAGRCLESYSKVRTDDAVASLGKLRPSDADLVELRLEENNGSEESEQSKNLQRIGVDLLEIGDIVIVSHGSSPPADGIVASTGIFRFDESSLTGESTPIKKKEGDSVYAGSVNIGPPLHVQLTGVGGSSMLDHIISVVREGQSKKASLERAADTLTAHFVPVITLVAIVTFAVWLSLGLSGVLPTDYLDIPTMGWTFWSLEFAIAVFVVACPCGLALAAPTALFVGGGVAARHGILVKGGGEAFQEASRLDAVIFDKTGTLTDSSSLQVSDYEILAGDAEQLRVGWAVAQQLEENSNHPIAKAVREFCRAKGPNGPSVNVTSADIYEVPGHGMQGRFVVAVGGNDDEGRTATEYEAAIGNERLLQQVCSSSGNSYYLSSLLSKYQGAGKSVAILSLRKCFSDGHGNDDGHPNGVPPFSPVIIFAISESIRSGAARVVSALLKRRINVFMCTGDNQVTAHAIADTLGIPRGNVMADALPTEKAAFVHEVQRSTAFVEPTTRVVRRPAARHSGNQNSIVAFVGDGVNDAPALAAADVSIALSSGSDVALSSSSFILLNTELSTVLRLVLLSRRVFRRVKLNFGWALIYNLILIPIAAGVLYPIVVGHTERIVDGEVILVDKHWRLSPVWAALAMALSSISVVCSSLALGMEERYAEGVF